MRTVKKIMIGLDLTQMDKVLLKQLDYLCKCINPEEIHFIHVHKKAIDPNFSSFTTTNLMGKPVSQLIENEIEQAVEKYFTNFESYNLEYHIAEGSIAKVIFKEIVTAEIDLLIVGRKKNDGGGLSAKNLCRNSRCSVLFIPEKGISKINHILNPIDFSRFSKHSTKLAIDFAQAEQSKITALYIYDLPAFGHNANFNSLYEPKIIGFATQTYNKYISYFDTQKVDIKPKFEMNVEYKGPQLAYEIATTQNTDLIILSSHGKSAFNVFMIGSFTEKLMDMNRDIPLLMSKCSSFFENKMNNQQLIQKVDKIA